MSQAPTNGQNLMDPFGIWKAARDANLEAWSKLMIDVVNSNEYAQATGFALEQVLATSQPFRDSMEKSMTQTLSMLNMPSRAEVISIAERLVNVEMRLDDLDAKLNGVQKTLQTIIKDTAREAATTQTSHLKGIENQLQAVNKLLTELKVSARAAAPPKLSPKAETRPAQPSNKESSRIKEQEAK